MSFSPLTQELIEAFRCLPGVGPKSAQRMALQILEKDRSRGKRLADALQAAVDGVGHCRLCRSLTEYELCDICDESKSARRDRSSLCVVENPSDVFAIEQSGSFRGLYFVLMGHLSPIDGVGPAEIGIDRLVERVRDDAIREIIIATNPTIEGEATAHYISEQFDADAVTVSRIAHGVPLGGELEYVDMGTLAHAFKGRKALS